MSVKTKEERAVILAVALDIVTQSKLNGMTTMLNKIGIEIEQKKVGKRIAVRQSINVM